MDGIMREILSDGNALELIIMHVCINGLIRNEMNIIS